MNMLKATTLLLFATPVFANTPQYAINTKVTVIDSYTVDVEIDTNIKDDIELAANLSLHGQSGKDTFIGTNFVKVPVHQGKAKITLNGNNDPQPKGSLLPKGSYDVEVTFYPEWASNQEVAHKFGIKKTIEKIQTVSLLASGQPISSLKEQLDVKHGQLWLMKNFTSGMPWVPSFWSKKFGKLQQVEYKGELNPKIIKMYYLKSIDCTLMVNDYKKEIDTFKIGLAYE
jgi:hypothetical protein